MTPRGIKIIMILLCIPLIVTAILVGLVAVGMVLIISQGEDPFEKNTSGDRYYFITQEPQPYNVDN